MSLEFGKTLSFEKMPAELKMINKWTSAKAWNWLQREKSDDQIRIYKLTNWKWESPALDMPFWLWQFLAFSSMSPQLFCSSLRKGHLIFIRWAIQLRSQLLNHPNLRWHFQSQFFPSVKLFFHILLFEFPIFETGK